MRLDQWVALIFGLLCLTFWIGLWYAYSKTQNDSTHTAGTVCMIGAGAFFTYATR